MTSKSAGMTEEVKRFTLRKERADALFEQWMVGWRNLLTSRPTDFERFCKPTVVHMIVKACGPFVMSGERYDFRETDFPARLTGLSDPGAPVVITATVAHKAQRLDGDRRPLAPYPGEVSPVEITFVLETDPGITWIEKVLRAEIGPSRPTPRPSR